MKNAKNRALSIFDILFPEKVDALFFHNYHCDYDTSSNDSECINWKNIIKDEKDSLLFSLGMQRKYTHHKVRLEISDPDEDILGINRMICYSPTRSDCKKYIKKQLIDYRRSRVHFVNEELNCILSIYDDRGCDIVFFDEGNFLKMYQQLKPYFLEYDLSLVEERVQNARQRAQRP